MAGCTRSCDREYACILLFLGATFGMLKILYHIILIKISSGPDIDFFVKGKQYGFRCNCYISAFFLHIGSPCINDINNNGYFCYFNLL